MKKIIGYILFLGGITTALILAVSPDPLSLNFIASTVLAAVGALFLRFSRLDTGSGKASILQQEKPYKQILETITSEIKKNIQVILWMNFMIPMPLLSTQQQPLIRYSR